MRWYVDRIMRSANACFTIMLWAALSPVATQASARDGTAAFDVFVVDAASRQPLAFARAAVTGPVQTFAAARADGHAVLDDLPAGLYRLVVRAAGYRESAALSVDAQPNTVQHVIVELARTSALREIGRVRVGATTTRNGMAITSGAAQRKIADSLSGAVLSLPGALGMPFEDNTAVSLEGHDARQTALTLDGLPLLAPGTQATLAHIGEDVFAGASLSFEPQAGRLAGGVDLRTLIPTKQWQAQGIGTLGTRGDGYGIVSVQGSTGRLGTALQTAVRGSASLADGTFGADSSGLAYERSASTTTRTTMLRLQQLIGDRGSLIATHVETGAVRDLNCTAFTASEPCGFGPGNLTTSRYTFGALSASYVAGTIAMRLATFGSRDITADDLEHRLFGGRPFPSADSAESMNGGYLLSLSATSGPHTVAFMSTNSAYRNTVTSEASGFRFGDTIPGVFSSMALSDTARVGRAMRLTVTAGSNNNGAQRSATGGLEAKTELAPHATLTASVLGGQLAAVPNYFTTVSDPQSLIYACTPAAAFGTATARLPYQQQDTSTYRLQYAAGTKHASIVAIAYQQVTHGADVRVPLSVAALGPDPFLDSLAAQAATVFREPFICGASASLSPDRVYLVSPLTSANVAFRGIRVNAFVESGNGLVIHPQLAVQQAVLHSSDPRLRDPSSFVSNGRMRGVPLLSGALLVDYKRDRSPLEYLANLRYFGPNNLAGERPLVLADMGVVAQTARGSVTLRASNIFGTGAREFTTLAPDSVTRNDGIPITLPRPSVAARRISITYTLQVGAYDRPEPGERSLVSNPAAQQPALSAIPSSPPEDPYRMRNAATTCPFEVAKALGPVLASLHAFTGQLDRSAPAERAAVPIPSLAGAAITVHPSGPSYTVILEIRDFALIRGIFGCLHVATATDTELASKGVYAETVGYGGILIHYSPAIGFFVATTEKPLTSPRFYSIDQTPQTPFALETGAQCDERFRPDAERLLDALRRYFDGPTQERAETSLFEAIRHGNGAATWYTIRFSSPAGYAALVRCAHVSRSSRSALERRGLSGFPPPVLQFAPGVGFYTIE